MASCHPPPIALLRTAPRSVTATVDGGPPLLLIERRERLPAVATMTISATGSNLTEVAVKLFAGELSDWDGRIQIGQIDIDGLRPSPKGAPHIEMLIDLGSDGVLTATATNLQSGKEWTTKFQAFSKGVLAQSR